MKINMEPLLLLLTAISVCVLWTSSNIIAATEPNGASLVERDRHLLVSTERGLSTETIIQKRSQTTREPYFVLHIGPQKTATTTIQCALHRLNENLANEDSYYFVGKTCPDASHRLRNNETAIQGHHLLMGLNGGNPQTRGYIGLKSRMDYHKSRGNNIIYSNEAFANHMVDQNATWEVFRTLFVGWKVRIVIGYRHYFDWIRSLYYQQFLDAKKYNRNWPNQGKGKAHPSFLKYLDYHLRHWEANDQSVDGGHSAHALGHHLTVSAYKKFSPYFDDVQIFNLYEDGDLATNFVCNMLPDAENTCNILRSKGQDAGTSAEAKGLVKRVSKSFDAQRISEAAYINGYFDTSSSKEEIVKMVEAKIEKVGLNLSSRLMACASPALEARFLDASIAYEKEVLSIDHKNMEMQRLDTAIDAHIGMFQQSKAEGRFCEVDTKLLLSDKRWRKYLSELSHT